MSLQWGLQRAVEDHVPAYLESTIDAAPLYEKNGFKAVEKLSMILASMTEDGAPVVYEETCFISRPSVSGSNDERTISPSNLNGGRTYRDRTGFQWTTRTCLNV